MDSGLPVLNSLVDSEAFLHTHHDKLGLEPSTPIAERFVQWLGLVKQSHFFCRV